MSERLFLTWSGVVDSQGTPMEGQVEVSVVHQRVNWGEETATWPAHGRSGGGWEQSFTEVLEQGPQGGWCPPEIVQRVIAFVTEHYRRPAS